MIDIEGCMRLAAYLCELDYENIEDETEIWDATYEKYNLEESDFVDIISCLLPLIQCGRSEITGSDYVGFGKTLPNNKCEMFIKMTIPNIR